MAIHSKNDFPRLVRSDRRFEKNNIEVIFKEYNTQTWHHWHDYFELEYFASGTGEYQVNGMDYHLEAGSCYMVTPADFHHLSATSNMVIYNIAFNDLILTKEAYDKIYSNDQWPAIRFTQAEIAFIEPLFHKLKELYDADSEACPLRDRAIADLLEFIVILYMQKIENHENVDNNVSSIVMQAVSYIKYNFKNKLTLQGVAATIPITPNYLGARFTEQMGVSFNTYLMQTRLSYAHNLLKSDRFSVEEVAFASGFGTASYFSDCFRKYYGYSPVDMRKILNASEKGRTVSEPIVQQQ
ncbi:MAG: helix-turn-helix domain-containing protein [Eubacteriales bacterium]